MSNWTHVAAVARIDAWPWDNLKPEDIFGKTVRYEDDAEAWEEAETHPERFLPLGSEGSLEISVWENPERNDLAKYSVMIFGDLRDHDSPQAIVDWFKDKLAGLMIRQATIVVENEWYGNASWAYLNSMKKTEDEGENT